MKIEKLSALATHIFISVPSLVDTQIATMVHITNFSTFIIKADADKALAPGLIEMFKTLNVGAYKISLSDYKNAKAMTAKRAAFVAATGLIEVFDKNDKKTGVIQLENATPAEMDKITATQRMSESADILTKQFYDAEQFGLLFSAVKDESILPEFSVGNHQVGTNSVTLLRHYYPGVELSFSGFKNAELVASEGTDTAQGSISYAATPAGKIADELVAAGFDGEKLKNILNGFFLSL